ncbi:SARP family transcriptional regulator [Actinoplanes sp. NBRC 14428]|nr:SARP family transcriptional regulator [Actinoplanes sp. NBRC 14428]
MLGAVEVVAGGRVLGVGRPQQAVVFAVLVAEAGRAVSVGTLVDRVWGDAPPQRARRLLQTHVARLRRVLEQASAFGGGAASVVRRGDGYLLDVRPEAVDLERFRGLVARAGAAGCPAGRRAALLREALELWRGEPLAGLAGEWVERTRHVWAQQRLDAVLEWARAELDGGDPAAALPRLGELVGEHPLMESLAAVYMRTLYATGRPADALHHYTALRRRLADELGTDPGGEIQRLHRQVLAADPVLAPPGSPAVPRQLPAAPRNFTGRLRELAALDRSPDVSAVVITAIDGMAGIGKTALAVQVAHRLAGRYPDGQMFLDLHGYTRETEPTEPAEALDHLLRGLGVPGTEIPAGLDRRAALYRTRLAGRRMLIVLDNAATEAQVAPLLPGSAGCLVLVTSRRRMTGLDHARTLSLDTLSLPEAVELFTRAVDGERLAGEPAERVAELVELCGRLPLAVRIAAARLGAHPSWRLPDLVRRLRDRRQRLRELEAGQRSVTAALDVSYQDLDPELRRMYRSLGVHPGPDLDAYGAAALAAGTVPRADRLLDRLHDAHLVQEPTPGRYRFHDLIRAHAAHTAAGDDTRAAFDRLLRYYEHTASAAVDAAYPYEGTHRPRGAPVAAPDLGTPEAARAWLDAELANLLAAARHAVDRDRPGYVRNLSGILHRHLATRGRYHDAGILHGLALAAARAAGHQEGELDALLRLGTIHRWQGRHDEAIDHHERALHIARALGDGPGELKALTGLGHLHREQGRDGTAADHHERALRIARAVGHRQGELDALVGLGRIHLRQGRYDRAADHHRQALRIARGMGHGPGELRALTGLGHAHRRQGRYEQAAGHYERALRVARAVGHRQGELEALVGLGRVHLWQGRAADPVLRLLTELGVDPADDEEATVAAIRTHLAHGDRAGSAACQQFGDTRTPPSRAERPRE